MLKFLTRNHTVLTNVYPKVWWCVCFCSFYLLENFWFMRSTEFLTTKWHIDTAKCSLLVHCLTLIMGWCICRFRATKASPTLIIQLSTFGVWTTLKIWSSFISYGHAIILFFKHYMEVSLVYAVNCGWGNVMPICIFSRLYKLFVKFYYVQVAKVVKAEECDGDTLQRVFEAIGFPFLIRLLKSSKFLRNILYDTGVSCWL